MPSSNKDLKEVWGDLAVLINDLPKEDRKRYQSAIRILAHDLRQSIAIIYSAENLLRRVVPATQENLELLDSIKHANQRTIGLITELSQPFERGNTMPMLNLTNQPKDDPQT